MWKSTFAANVITVSCIARAVAHCCNGEILSAAQEKSTSSRSEGPASMRRGRRDFARQR
jgi:hypothetical protein